MLVYSYLPHVCEFGLPEIISHLLTPNASLSDWKQQKGSLGILLSSTIRRTVNKDVEHLSYNANLTARKLKPPFYILILNYTKFFI